MALSWGTCLKDCSRESVSRHAGGVRGPLSTRVQRADEASTANLKTSPYCYLYDLGSFDGQQFIPVGARAR